MERINYDDKVALYENPDIADITKVNASDMNNIKSTINGALDGTNPMGSIVVDDISGKNLFDAGNYNVINASFTSDGGVISSGTNARTLYLPVKPNTTYTVSKTTSSRFRLCTTAEIPASNVSISDYIGDDGATSLTITTSALAKYLCMYVYVNGTDTLTLQQIADTIQVELGTEKTDYTPYIQPVKKTSLGVKEDTTFYANDFKCRNLFDINTMIELTNQVRRYSDGNVVSVSGYYGIKVPVNANTTYVVSSSLTTRDNISNLCYFNGTTYISGEAFGSGSLSFTTPSNCNYITLAIANTFTWCQLEIGNEATPYTPYKNFENEEIYSTNEIKIGKWIDGKDLYRKVVDFGALPNATTKGVAHNISNLGTVTNCYGYASISNTKLSINWYNGTNYITTFVTNTVVNIQTSNDRSSYTAYVIIEYTKTS